MLAHLAELRLTARPLILLQHGVGGVVGVKVKSHVRVHLAHLEAQLVAQRRVLRVTSERGGKLKCTAALYMHRALCEVAAYTKLKE